MLLLLLKTDKKTNTGKEDGVLLYLQPSDQSRKPSANFVPAIFFKFSKSSSLTPLKAAGGFHAMVQRRGKGKAGVERRPAHLRMSAGEVELFK